MIYMVAGAVLALAIFLYLYSLHPEERFARKQIKREVREGIEQEDDGSMRPRFCPVCGHPLKPGEFIYAEIIHAEPHDKVIIKGCKYCYVPTPSEKVMQKPYTGSGK